MSTELLDTYARATDEQRERGRAWYARMRQACEGIAKDTGVPLARVAATAAITSPDAQLSTNLAWTRKACETRGDAAVGRYPNAMAARYRPILAGAVPPADGVGGPKVTAFYRAIMGDADAIVLDRWALRAVGHPRDTATPRQYERLAAVYADIAAQVGEHPRDFQAIVWIVLRDEHTDTNGRRVKLRDIHDLREAA